MTDIVNLLKHLVEKITGVNFSRTSRDDHNWPAVTATEKLDRRLPTEYPFERQRSAWPPFTGERVPLGG